jgi:hypothetical protein
MGKVHREYLLRVARVACKGKDPSSIVRWLSCNAWQHVGKPTTEDHIREELVKSAPGDQGRK